MNIKNENLKIYLQTILNKSIDTITKADLININNISLIGSINDNSNLKIDYNDISLFPNLTELLVSNTYITIKDIEEINKYSNIKRLSFDKCLFENNNYLFSNNIKSLELIDCHIDDYTFLANNNSLEELTISNPYTDSSIDLSSLSNMLLLKKLVLNRCLIDNFASLNNLSSLEYLSVLWTTLPDNYLEIINKLSNLKQLYISSEYNTNNINKNIIVKHDLNEYTIDK